MAASDLFYSTDNIWDIHYHILEKQKKIILWMNKKHAALEIVSSL